jgi:hypothetical protein
MGALIVELGRTAAFAEVLPEMLRVVGFVVTVVIIFGNGTVKSVLSRLRD